MDFINNCTLNVGQNWMSAGAEHLMIKKLSYFYQDVWFVTDLLQVKRGDQWPFCIQLLLLYQNRTDKKFKADIQTNTVREKIKSFPEVATRENQELIA